MCPRAYSSAPVGTARPGAPCGSLRVSTMRSKGSFAWACSHSISRNVSDIRVSWRFTYAVPSCGDRRSAEFETPLGIIGDVLSDRKRRRRRGRRRVADMDDALGAFEDEVVDERAVGPHRLRAHAGRAREAVLGLQLGDVALQRLDVRAAHEIAIDLARPGAPII